MAIISGSLERLEEEVVYSEDQDVDARGKYGWLPVTECIVKPGADRLTIRSLGVSEWAECREAFSKDGMNPWHVAIAKHGVIAVNGKRHPGEISEYLSTMYLHHSSGTAHYLLVELIASKTQGYDLVDYRELSRRLIGGGVDEPRKSGDSQGA